MPLQLRRGTNAERQLITPQEGELIYVTDYEIRNVSSMWVGDGFTPGGNPVDSAAGTMSLSSLTDVDVTSVSPQIGDVLKWNGTFFTPQPDIDTQGATYIDITSVSPQIGDVLKWNGAFFTPQLVDGVVPGGNYNINVVGDDSTIIVDSTTNSINSGTIDAAGEIRVSNSIDRSYLKLTRTSTGDISNSSVGYGAIYFDRDDLNGNIHTALIAGGRDYIVLGADPDSIFPENTLLTITYGNLGIGTYNPLTKLDVRGDGKFSGYVQFGSYTTTERDAITADNGMIIYNTTDNRFQGYQNNGWINLDNASPA